MRVAVAQIELERARDKDYVIPGEYELYLLEHRRPELYGALVEPSTRLEPEVLQVLADSVRNPVVLSPT